MGHRVEPEKGGEIETKNTTKNIKHYWISQNKPINKTCVHISKNLQYHATFLVQMQEILTIYEFATINLGLTYVF